MPGRRLQFAISCPRCGGSDTPVRDTAIDDAYLARTRHCRSCGLDFDTYEIPAAALAQLIAKARERRIA